MLEGTGAHSIPETNMLCFILLIVLRVRGPWDRKLCHPCVNQSCATKEAKDASKFYANIVPEEDKSSMQDLKRWKKRLGV